MLFLLFTRLSDLYRPAAWPVSLNQLLVLVVLLLMLLRRQALIGDRGLGFMVAYGAAIVLSSIGSADRVAPLAAAAAYAHDVVIVFLVLNLLGSFGSLRAATWTIMAAGTFAAGLALVHAWTGLSLGTLAMVDFGNLAGSTVGYRAAGTIGNSNAFAQMLVCAMPFALYRVWGEKARRLRVVALVSVLAISSALVLTYSRGGGIAFLGALALSLALQHLRPLSVATVALVLTVAALTAPNVYWNRVGVTTSYVLETSGGAPATTAELSRPGDESAPDAGTTESSQARPVADATPLDTGSLPERVSLWKVGLLMFAEHPLTGVGKNTYLQHYPAYASRVDPTLVSSPKVAHSTPIQILADTGIIGFATFGVLLCVVAWGIWSARATALRAHGHSAVLLVEPIAVALFAYVITSMFQSDDYPRFLWILLALAMAARQIVRRTPPRALGDTALAQP